MKKKILSLLFVVCAFYGSASAAYELVWSDEFECESLNTTAWTYEIGTGYNGWGNWEREYYTNSTNNVYIDNGSLVIKAIKDNTQYDVSYTTNFTSGRIKTAGKFSMKYGKVEARIKLPSAAKGVWPAFWMLGSEGSWPYCGETDIMEYMCTSSNYSAINSTIHWHNGSDHASYGNAVNVSDPTSYHVYSLEWTPDLMTFKVDDTQIVAADINSSTAPTLSAFHKEFYIILNLAIGGAYVNYEYDESITEKAMYVDYVRVYQNSTAYPASAVTDNTTACDSEDDPDEGDDTSDCNLAPEWSLSEIYYAPNWSQSSDYSFSLTSGNSFSFTSNSTCSSQWQAQVKLSPTSTLDLAGGVDYTMSMNISASKEIGGVTVKLYQRGADGMYIFLRDADIDIEEGGTYSLSMNTIDSRQFSDAVIVFDFGWAAEGTVIEVEDIVVKETSCVPTSAAEEAAVDVNVWPNPTTGVVNLTSDSNIQNIYVYSMAGALVEALEVNDDECVVDMASYGNGLYMIAIETATGTQTRRVIKR